MSPHDRERGKDLASMASTSNHRHDRSSQRSPQQPSTAHMRSESSSSAVQTMFGRMMGNAGVTELSHRHSASIDRNRMRVGQGHPGTPILIMTSPDPLRPSTVLAGSHSPTSASSPSTSSSSDHSTGNPFLSFSDNGSRDCGGGIDGGGGNPHYSYAPSSPTVHAANFPSNYSATGYTQRGVKHTGLGMSRTMASTIHDMDDAASINSLVFDREPMSRSLSGHSCNGSDDDYTSYTSHSGATLSPATMAALGTNGLRGLRQKTSFTHLKDSDHKILSNEEKYNAYVLPGVAQYDGPEPDDVLHDPGPRLKAIGPDRRLVDSRELYGTTSLTSFRGWLNAIGITLIMLAMITFFAGYPLSKYVQDHLAGGSMLFVNGTGQIPDIQNFRGLVDRATPLDAYTRIGQDGLEYKLIFSDEFNTDGRTFYDGDDPYWTAVDLHYYPTADVEYYDPSQAYTRDGYLHLNLSRADRVRNHNMSFISSMIQGWNQFCFTGGIIEASVSLPGNPTVTGLWPAFWTMGNLGRAGYGSSTDGTWPYSYDSCDSGTLKNQTDKTKGIGPWQTSWDAPLSFLPGQKFSACTCEGEDHPGPSNNVGRAAPELDVFEAIVNPTEFYGEISQTMQIAPYDADYKWPNTSTNYVLEPEWETEINSFRGGVYQQSISGLAKTDQKSYYLLDRSKFQTYAVEYKPSEGTNYDGYVYWTQNNQVGWMIHESALPPNSTMDISQRLIPREPMYMIMNLGMSEGFNPIDLQNLTFPSIMRFDWVRVYQRPDAINIGCDPKTYPTRDYIERHLNSYTDYNLTVWDDADPKGFPKNSLVDSCSQ